MMMSRWHFSVGRWVLISSLVQVSANRESAFVSFCGVDTMESLPDTFILSNNRTNSHQRSKLSIMRDRSLPDGHNWLKGDADKWFLSSWWIVWHPIRRNKHKWTAANIYNDLHFWVEAKPSASDCPVVDSTSERSHGVLHVLAEVNTAAEGYGWRHKQDASLFMQDVRQS